MTDQSTTHVNSNASEAPASTASQGVTLEVNAERSLVAAVGGSVCIDFTVRCLYAPPQSADRQPIALALVLDRSGSMSGSKLGTAKQAALQALARLTPTDQAALVVYDSQIDVLQPMGNVTPELRRNVQAKLGQVQARASTALFEGWLTGCKTIAPDSARPRSRSTIDRCFLLTDGLANVGVTDPEAIATEAGKVLQAAGISTSTFGIGDDYSEALLGPMAVAGGGQFHHLRTVEDMQHSFQNELGELFKVAVNNVMLELRIDGSVEVEMISDYAFAKRDDGTIAVQVGALLSGEERHIVLRLQSASAQLGSSLLVKSRVVWADQDGEKYAVWQHTALTYATQADCLAQPINAAAGRWIALHLGYRAIKDSTQQSKEGKLAEAGETLRQAADAVFAFAPDDQEVRQLLDELKDTQQVAMAAPMAPASAKEQYYQAVRRSRNQRDLR